MRLLFALLVFIVTVSIITDTRATAGEWQEKPVMCGPEEEIFRLKSLHFGYFLYLIQNLFQYQTFIQNPIFKR